MGVVLPGRSGALSGAGGAGNGGGGALMVVVVVASYSCSLGVVVGGEGESGAPGNSRGRKDRSRGISLYILGISSWQN